MKTLRTLALLVAVACVAQAPLTHAGFMDTVKGAPAYLMGKAKGAGSAIISFVTSHKKAAVVLVAAALAAAVAYKKCKKPDNK